MRSNERGRHSSALSISLTHTETILIFTTNIQRPSVMYVMMVFRFVHINLYRTVSFDLRIWRECGLYLCSLPIYLSVLYGWLAGSAIYKLI